MKTDKFVIRGITFKRYGRIPVHQLSGLYLMFKALEGDQISIDLLEAAGTVISDYDGKQIYPPKV